LNYIAAAAVTNVSYACGNTANGVVVKRNSGIKVATWTSISGLVVFLVPMLLFFRTELSRLTLVNIALTASISCLGLSAYACFLTGMQRGSVTVAGVITGAFPAIAAIVALLLFGERITLAQAVLIGVIVGGALLASCEDDFRVVLRGIRSSSLIFPFAAAVLFGFYFALVRIPVERVGWFVPQYGANIVGVPLYLFYAKRLGESEPLTLPKRPFLIATIATIQIGATMLYSYAITKGPTSIIAPIAGSYPALFVVFAFIVFRERLRRVQYVGILATVVGITVLALLS
jgi:transporter family protein